MNVAFIPVRGGSKSIPLKNIKSMCGKPLVYWSVKAACECEYIDKVFVATDSEIIKDTIDKYKQSEKEFSKLQVIERSKESATDTASTEYAMLEFADKYEFDNIVLIQATSPLITALDLKRGFEMFNKEAIDSVLSVVKQKRFNWSVDKEGIATALNYDIFNRPRRQEFDGYYVENGAFYISTKEQLVKSQNRISGNIGIVEMDEDTFFEIDEPSDWKIIEQLLKKRNQRNNIIKDMKLFLTDCDGCLTDSGMYYSEKGDELKKFNTKDGMAFKLLKNKGVLTGIVTGENVNLNKRRAQKLGVDFLRMGCDDKLSEIKDICESNGIDLSQVVYVGDDINDLETIDAVGFGCAPSDAVNIVKEHADYIANLKGGEGVIREIVEFIFGDQIYE